MVDFSPDRQTETKALKALLFINLYKTNAARIGENITARLNGMGIEVHAFTFAGRPDFSTQEGYDIAFSLGGDGTVLYTARTMAPLGVPILPLNLGTLGFIAAVPPDDWETVFETWLVGKAPLSRRLMLELRVERGGRTVLQGSCLNDAVISASGIAKIIHLQVSSETAFTAGAEPGASRRYEHIRLGSYRSDGLIVSTPTGSTAYSVAAGGPILDPEMEAFIINPICPFTLSNRPVVVPAWETVIVEIEAVQRSGVLLTVDGQITEPLEPLDRIYIKKASYQAGLIASGREAFYTALLTKLNWFGIPGGYGSLDTEGRGASHA
ncbi:MAG: NAD(+)/NADH kinase [Treponema sp.]|jgi:NAD+ kinase|nr:NAD(+)/NADH kinase [Treponema sp.]